MNIEQEFKDLGDFLWNIFKDAIIVLAVAVITFLVKSGIELLYQKAIEKIDNIAVISIYYTSKWFLIIIFLILVIFDILILIKRKVKEFKES